MADSVTTNYGLTKPEVGASNNTWGAKTNANWDDVDELIARLDALNAAVKSTLSLNDRVGILDSESDPALELKYATLTAVKTALFAAVSLADNIFELKDNTDDTKKLAFQLSGITAGQTRTLSAPDLSGVIALLSGAQTFTDKTLTQPILVLKQGAAEAPTAEGDTRWDTDDNVLVIGDGAAAKTFIAIPASTAAGDLFYLSAAKVAARLAKSTKGKALRMNSGATAPEWGGAAPDAVLEHREASGANGGALTAGVWTTRTLNTEVRDTYGVMTLAGNQFTPNADGWVEWEFRGRDVSVNQTRLFNVTDAVAVAYGLGRNIPTSVSADTMSAGGGAVVAGKTYRVEHRVTDSSSIGMGSACSFGGDEVYGRVKFWIT